VGGSLQRRESVQPIPLDASLQPEETLSANDPILADVIRAQMERWPSRPTEDPIWGLVRIIFAQQVTTNVACQIAQRAKSAFPDISSVRRSLVPCVADLRAFGVPERRAACCIEILTRAREIQSSVQQGRSWEFALAGIKGIGPWTLATFRIMVLRDPDVLPLGDVGLERAVRNSYGLTHNIEHLAERWKPFRSVACWYLWRTLGNQQLG
jgi:DNA-3-methyladenine glycosylase II